MASLINSLRNITGDSFWVVKLTVFAYFAFFIFINQDIIFQNNPTNMIILSVIFLIYIGSASVMIHRNVNNIYPILPSFTSIPEILIKGISSVVVSLPFTLIFIYVLSWMKTNMAMEPLVMSIIYICVSLFFASFILIPIVLYSVQGRVNDAFRFNLIVQGAGNFIVQFLSYIIQYIFIVLLGAFLFYRLLVEMLGYTIAVEILFGYLIAVTIFSVFSFCSDMYADVIPEIKIKTKTKRKR